MNNTKVGSEQKLTEQLNDLPKALHPKRDLWPGIERAIQHKQQFTGVVETKKTTSYSLAWAASVLVAVLITWVSVSSQLPDSPALLVKQMQQGFEQQKQAMLVTFGRPNIEDLPLNLQKQLEGLASARKSIERALLEDPANADLLNILRWTQAQELELITQLYSPKWQTI